MVFAKSSDYLYAPCIS